ncbi:flotillin family protein [Candidatus Sumerlaeota bacterium]|nr:flotillin family protein [Candidatus Sumerlaeota bacterium]
MFQILFILGIMLAVFLCVAFIAMVLRCYRKVEQGTALIKVGPKNPTVHFSRAIIWPIINRAEIMDISVKRIEIFRHGSEGLNCKDNLRADIKVAFFVRVNPLPQDVLKVAGSIGSARASEPKALVELFDAKFSEALKTVGKKFDFEQLYTSRDEFKEEIIKIIGRDLNGYLLEDAAIDYLEQTPLEQLEPNNILDAEGIKKITDLTAKQAKLANEIQRDKEKVIRKQDVEARETILELDRQQAEAEEKQKREIAVIAARERAEAAKVQQEEHLRAEQARIHTEEEVQVQEQNKDRQIIVAQRNKERTDGVEQERVQKERQLEATERERVVQLAQIEKDKAVEVEKKAIQDVIRERVMVQRAVVEEEQKILDTEEFAKAERAKRVAIVAAEKEAQEGLVKQVKSAEAARDSAKFKAEEEVTLAEAERAAAEKETAAKKMLAEGIAAEEAAIGIAEATVIEKKALAEAAGLTAKADAVEKHGTAEATVIERKITAEAKGQEAKAVAIEKQGAAEAAVMQMKFEADAKGITDKAGAMKIFNEAGKEHEEFKLRLQKDKDVELAAIDAQRKIAEQQAGVLGEALKQARIDIVGGETEFFDRITKAISGGKAMDRWIDNSRVLTDVKNTFFNGDNAQFRERLHDFIEQFGLDSEDVKNLSVAALIGKLIGLADKDADKRELKNVLNIVRTAGIEDKTLKDLGLSK